MLFSKEGLVAIIKQEISERVEDSAPREEVIALKELMIAVGDEKTLEFAEYQWLCDLVGTHVHMQKV